MSPVPGAAKDGAAGGGERSPWTPRKRVARTPRPWNGRTTSLVPDSGRKSVGPAHGAPLTCSTRLFFRAGLPDPLHHFFDGRLEEQALPGHQLPVHRDGELPPVSVHQLDLEPRLLPQRVRHTGGMFSGPASARALPNRDLLHQRLSFWTWRYKKLPRGIPSWKSYRTVAAGASGRRATGPLNAPVPGVRTRARALIRAHAVASAWVR